MRNSTKNLKLVILLCLCYKGELMAQNFHAFLFCKTADSTIGTSAQVNFGKMHDQLQLLADALHLHYAPHPVTGSRFSLKELEKEIASVKVERGDYVVMYYSTHGAKSEFDSNIFPQLAIPNTYVSAYKKHQEMLGNKPAFLMTILEACSGYLDITPQQAFVTEQAGGDNKISELNPRQIENIKKLFSSNCEIIVAAGEPGKNTYASSKGSLFTNSLLRAMNQYIDMKPSRISMVTWENLLEQSSAYTSQLTADLDIQYHPVWESKDCNQLFAQYQTSTAAPERRDVVMEITLRKRLSLISPYGARLTIKNNSGKQIDSVVWYLDPETFKRPIQKRTNAADGFLLRVINYDGFPVKAKIYFKDGVAHDLYRNLELGKALKRER